MCTNYTPTERERLNALRLGVIHLPVTDWPPEVFPGYQAPILVADPGGAEAAPLCQVARFGLVPRWCKDDKQAIAIGRRTYNARSETVSEKPSYRAAWRERRFALVPMENFFEPCWEDAPHNGGRAVRWRIGRADGQAFAVAALWERWTAPETGDVTTSFTLLTVNADGHPLMGRMHRPGEEKRMVVIVPPERCADWLRATHAEAVSLMKTTLAEDLRGSPALRPALPSADRKKPTGGLF